MNLTATLCQTWSPSFFTFYKQNNNKNVKKLATAFERAWPLNSSSFSWNAQPELQILNGL